MILRQVAQRVVDLDRAVKFYSQVLETEPIAVFNPPGLAFFALGDTRLLLDVGAPTALIYLQVDDVSATTEKLRSQGIKVTTEPHVVFPDDAGLFDSPGNEWLAFLEDSEGNQLGLMGRERNRD